MLMLLKASSSTFHKVWPCQILKVEIKVTESQKNIATLLAGPLSYIVAFVFKDYADISKA